MKILIIEDNNSISENISDFLPDNYYEYIIANKFNYKNNISNNRFNLVLLEWNYPFFSAIKILTSIREQFNQLELPVIVISDYTNDDYISDMLRTGANDYIIKPFNEINLKLKINNNVQMQTLYNDLQNANTDLLKLNEQYELQLNDYRQLAEHLNRTNIKLVASEERFKAIFENSHDAIGVSKEGIHVFCNDSYLKLFGYSDPEEIIGKPIYDLLSPNARQQIISNTEQRKSGINIPLLYETTGLRKNGQEFPFEIAISFYFIENEQYTIAIIRDISERRAFECEIIESRQKLKSLISAIPDLIFHLDNNGRFLTFIQEVPQYKELYSHPDFFSNKTVDEIFEPELASTFHEAIKATLLHGNYEHEYKLFKNELEFFNARYVKLNEKEIIAIVRNITKQKENEKIIKENQKLLSFQVDKLYTLAENLDEANEKLQLSEANYRRLLQMQGEGYIKVDENEVILFANQATEKIFDTELNNIIGKNLFDFIDELDKESIKYQTSIREKNISSSYEVTIRTFQNVRKNIIVTATPDFDDTNNFRGTFGVFRDITERKKLEEQLVSANEKLLQYNHLLEQKVEERTTELQNTNRELKIQNILFKTQQEASLDGILIVSEQRKILAYNRLFLEIWKIPEELFDKENDEEALQFALNQLENPDFFYNLVMNQYENKTNKRFDIIKFKNKNIIECYFLPMINDENVYLGNVWYFRDITERKKIEQEVILAKELAEERERQIKMITDNIPVNISKIDAELKYTFANTNVVKITNKTINEIIGNSIENVLGKDAFQRAKPYYTDALHGKKVSYDNYLINKDGKKTYFKIEYIPDFKDDKVIGIYNISYDITEQKEMEHKIFQTIIDTEEKERQKFAQELHDGIGPLLAAIKYYVQWNANEKNESKKIVITEKTVEMIKEAEISLKQISFGLSPYILQNFGIYDALNSFAQKIKEANPINIIINTNSKQLCDKTVETTIYRILTEFINNTLKYANATLIKIDIIIEDAILKVTYTDNGSGFNVNETLNHSKGIGIFNAKSRIKALNGQFFLTSEINKGTQLTILLELN